MTDHERNPALPLSPHERGLEAEGRRTDGRRLAADGPANPALPLSPHERGLEAEGRRTDGQRLTADGPTGPRITPLNTPLPIAVEATPRGAPGAVLWRGVYRPVAAIHDTWRIDDEWWREPIARRYFAVALEGGRHLTLYHDLATDAWYHQPYEPPRTQHRAS